MAKYEVEELIKLRETAHVPTSVDFAEFTKAILEERERQSQQEEEFGFQGGRRRSSHQGVRPKFKTHRPKRAPAPQPDADGWVTLDNHRKSVGSEEGASEKQKFKESLKDTQVKVRPNNKNLGSSKPVDGRDIIADQKKTGFNAFAALDDEDEDEDESDEDDE